RQADGVPAPLRSGVRHHVRERAFRLREPLAPGRDDRALGGGRLRACRLPPHGIQQARVPPHVPTPAAPVRLALPGLARGQAANPRRPLYPAPAGLETPEPEPDPEPEPEKREMTGFGFGIGFGFERPVLVNDCHERRRDPTTEFQYTADRPGD